MNILHAPTAKAIFNRNTRQWQTVNGKILASYPANIAGKTAARWHALRHNNPIIAEAAANLTDTPFFSFSSLETRTLSGAEIAADRRVITGLPNDDYFSYNAEIARVLRAPAAAIARVNNENSYAIMNDPNRQDHLICTCKDFYFNQTPTAANGQLICKHIAAFLITEEETTVHAEITTSF